MDIFIFQKKGFSERQSAKLRGVNQRQAILLDAHINSDAKIELLHSQKDYTLFPIFIEILCNLDRETETWEISAEAFRNWIKKKFEVNSRFDVLRRIEWLSNVGLIEFKHVSNDALKGQQDPNKDETNPKQDPNKGETNLKQEQSLPVREGENPHGSTRDLTNQQTNQASSCPRRFRSTDEQMAVAVWMAEKIREMNPGSKPPNLAAWANDIRLMIEQDGRSLEAIKELYRWVNADSFWRMNILSPSKLRDKWDQLHLKRLNPTAQRPMNLPQGTMVSGRSIVPAEQRESRSGKL